MPNLITNVHTTVATMPDNSATVPIRQDLTTRGLAPAEHYLDSGYPSMPTLVAARREHDITMITPLLGDSSRQARTGNGYVERPLGGKLPPVIADPAADSLPHHTHADNEHDDRLGELAFSALETIVEQLAQGAEPRKTVIDVLARILREDPAPASRADNTTKSCGYGHPLSPDSSVFDQTVEQVLSILQRQ